MIRLALILICLCSLAQAQPSLRGGTALRWEIDAPWFGGWSGIEVTDQGAKMTVISDRGQLVEATLIRENGKLEGVAVRSSQRLGRAAGGRLRKKASDAEGLAIAQNGKAFVSFEHRHRIMATDLASGRTKGRIALPFQNTLGDNAGIEALAIAQDGTLFAVAEQARADGGPFPLYAYANGKWRVSARIPQRGPFVPVGADFDSLGRLWLLERATTPLGFRSRIRLFVIDPRAAREDVIMTTIPARYDNLEGISVWEDARGQRHVTMISDDNFMRILRTQIVEYTVRE
ncbi:esterase-like activity of phytase family protein [uncultured Sulfitobacter sp.]|uniref:esterase-like activity of phytase family protein n=1 Tax=uncultured Sulfitobacter sp. TaxID=191468 RepID=UPI00261FEBCB|nr:esterase-like activity of phytase family protein [uncultured Sulfitobacter sp.]